MTSLIRSVDIPFLTVTEAKTLKTLDKSMKRICDLIEMDIEFYRAQYDDLRGMSEEEARNHYALHGYWEGRRCNHYDIRENFLGILTQGSVLEIGPYFTPLGLGADVSYLDIVEQKGLIARARNEGFDASNVPRIDYVSHDTSLDMVDRTFDIVLASHCIEHQPDLICHLNGVSDILKDGGIYALIIPNARFCFDALLPLTKISEIFNAKVENRKRHTLGSVIEHRALTTHNDCTRHWQEWGATDKAYQPIDTARVRAAIEAYWKAEDAYIDVHAWQFDPASFSDICRCLIELGAINYSKVTCYGPVRGRNEFTAILCR